jgi:hypothetical protein
MNKNSFVDWLALKMKNILLPGLLLQLCRRRTEDEGPDESVLNVQGCDATGDDKNY